MDQEIANQIAEDDTPLGEALPISEMPDEFGDLSNMNDFSYLGDDDDIRADDDTDADTVPAAEVERKPAEATSGEDSKISEPEPQVDPQSAEKLEAYERLDAALRENPGQAIKAIFAGMDPRDRAALASELVGGAQAPAQEADTFDLKEYEPQGEMEEALAKRWDSIEAIPAIIQAQNETDHRIEQGFATVAPHIMDANIGTQIALAKVDAICEALGIELPDPDSAAILKVIQGGKTTYRDAVRASANYKGQIDAHKQTRRPRPETPGGGPRSIEKIAAGTDAVAIARRLGVLPPR